MSEVADRPVVVRRLRARVLTSLAFAGTFVVYGLQRTQWFGFSMSGLVFWIGVIGGAVIAIGLVVWLLSKARKEGRGGVAMPRRWPLLMAMSVLAGAAAVEGWAAAEERAFARRMAATQEIKLHEPRWWPFAMNEKTFVYGKYGPARPGR